MVKWIGKFSLLLKRLKDSWIDMLPMSTLSEEQRKKNSILPTWLRILLIDKKEV